MATGKVKWFSDAKGYGFIRSEETGLDGKDIFVHYSEINGDGASSSDGRYRYRTLAQGQDVEFELTDTPRGLQAKKVQPLSS